MFIALIAIILANWALLVALNKRQELRCVANGKPAKIQDLSMMNQFRIETDEVDVEGNTPVHERQNMDEEVTDMRNDEFVFIY